MSKRRKKSSSVSALNQILRQPDLSILGNAITTLPPVQWQASMFFMGVPDSDFRQHTGGRFPATLRPNMDTHPVFVLATGSNGHILCPCTSKGNKQKLRYIQEGCRLEMSTQVMNRNSFLLEHYVFTMPLDSRFSRKLFFKGRVPEPCIIGGIKK
jgi:hypothetical protein